MLVKKAQPLPVECIVRGYISGSGWKEYTDSGSVCGIALPGGLKESQQLPEPIFTPSTKAEQGEHGALHRPDADPSPLRVFSQAPQTEAPSDFHGDERDGEKKAGDK